MRILVLGSGALGTVIGGALARKGLDVDLTDKNPEIIKALRKKGARVRGGMIFSVPVDAYEMDELTPGYDLLVLTTKSAYNEHLIPFLQKMLKEDGILITFQNGIPEPYLASQLGEQRIMGCAIDWTASFIEPGCSMVHTTSKTMHSYVGKMPQVPIGKAMETRCIMENVGIIHYETNMLGRRWSRLVSDCSVGAVSVMIGCTYGEMLSNVRARRLTLKAMKECIDVGRANDAPFTRLYGKKIGWYYYKNIFKKVFLMIALPIVYKHHKDSIHSLGQDLLSGRKTGIEFICGVVANYGWNANVPTPINTELVNIIHKQEEGLLPIGKETLKKIKF